MGYTRRNPSTSNRYLDSELYAAFDDGIGDAHDRIDNIGDSVGESAVGTVAELEALSGVSNGEARRLLGYYAAGDTDVDYPRYNSSSTTTVDNGTVFNGPAGVGRWHRPRRGSVRSSEFGITSGVNMTARVQAMLDAGAGKEVIFEPIASGLPLEVYDRVYPRSNTRVIGSQNLTIRQNTEWKPVFDIFNANPVVENVTLDLMDMPLRYEGTHNYTSHGMNIPGNDWRGQSATEQFSGVFVHGNGHKIRDVNVSGMWCGVMVNGFNNATNNQTSYFTKEIEVDGLRCDLVQFGVLAGAYDGLYIDRMRGTWTDHSPDTAPAGHFIYVTETEAALNRDLEMGRASCYGGTDDYAYYFKACRGAKLGQLYGRAVPILAIYNSLDVVIGEIIAHDATTASWCIDMEFAAPANLQRIVINSAVIQMAGDTRCVVLRGQNNRIDTLDLTINSPANADTHAVDVSGQDNTLGELKIRNAITGGGGRALNFVGGSGHHVGDVDTRDVKHPVVFEGTVADSTVEFDPTKMRWTAETTVTPMLDVGGSVGAGNKAFVKPHRKTYITSSGSAVTIYAKAQATAVVQANSTNAFTINAPLKPLQGSPLTVEIFNNSGGILGTITWNAVFKFHNGASQTSIASPTNGNRVSIVFEWDGTNWIELSRSG